MASRAGEHQTPSLDNRIDLGLTAEECTESLTEMRTMLASIQGILQGIGENDRERIAKAARQSGNRMARATPQTVRAKLPQAFRDLGGPTHMLFEELAVRAPTDDAGDRLAPRFAATRAAVSFLYTAPTTSAGTNARSRPLCEVRDYVKAENAGHQKPAGRPGREDSEERKTLHSLAAFRSAERHLRRPT